MMKRRIFLLLCLFFVFAGILTAQDTLRPAQPDPVATASAGQEDLTISQRIDQAFSPIVAVMNSILFWDPFTYSGLHDPIIYDDFGRPYLDKNGNPVHANLPFIVVWLIFGAVTFTVVMRFINIRGFRHALGLIQGKYDDPKNPGEVSHFQALTTALSATVGLGNIAGVAVAISIGGPGATLWMIIAGLLGMSAKFTECTLGVKYRKIDKNGVVSGGPMYYLREGLKRKKLKWLGIILAALFAVLVIGGSFGGGNMFQANQAFSQLAYVMPGISNHGAWFGTGMAVLVGIVIIGGIKGIARVTDKVVPIMALLYVGTALVIIAMNLEHTGEALSLIWNGAFNPGSLKGGVIGVLIVGFQRAAFSNEAGVGSAPIAHSAVKTDHPITEGLVALMEPFVDTVVICTMTALVLIFTGSYENPAGLEGAQLTSQAFGTVFSWFPYLLVAAIFLFAYSTMISWSYYGLKGFDYLFGGFSDRLFGSREVAKYVYFVIFLGFIVVGASSNLGAVIDFSDMMILAMGVPNILGLLILAPEVRRDLKTYYKQLKCGEIRKFTRMERREMKNQAKRR